MRKIFLLFAFLLSMSLMTMAQQTMKLSTGVNLHSSGGVIITLNDINLVNEGVIDQSTGQGQIRFIGTGNNSISGTGTFSVDRLVIAKTGMARLLLEKNIKVVSFLEFLSGRIDLNGNLIMLDPSASLIGESELSHVIGTGGYIEITLPLTIPTSQDPGNLGATITSSSNLGNTIIRRGHQVQVNGSGAGSSIQRYFDIIPANNSALNATVRLRYLDAELNGLGESTLVVWRSDDLLSWSNIGFTNRDLATNYLERDELQTLSRFTLSSVGNALPVEFISFLLRCEGSGSTVVLDWSTASEYNSSHFIIQRSADGLSWTDIGNVPAAVNSTEVKNYSYTDLQPLSSRALYRIAQYDIDGRVQYTPLRRADCGSNLSFTAWPNPVTGQLSLAINTLAPSVAIINIYDGKGALVIRRRQVLSSGNNQFAIDLGRLASGVYYLDASWNEGASRNSTRLIKK